MLYEIFHFRADAELLVAADPVEHLLLTVTHCVAEGTCSIGICDNLFEHGIIVFNGQHLQICIYLFNELCHGFVQTTFNVCLTNIGNLLSSHIKTCTLSEIGQTGNNVFTTAGVHTTLVCDNLLAIAVLIGRKQTSEALVGFFEHSNILCHVLVLVENYEQLVCMPHRVH